MILLSPSDARGEAGGDVTEARERFGRGVELYRAGEYEAALAEFQRAYELAPHYSVLYNIGQVQHHLDRNPEAVANLERYLAQGGSQIPASRRAEVDATLNRLERLVGSILVVVGTPENATVLVDGVESGNSPLTEPIRVGAGRHTVELRAEGFLPLSRVVTVAGGAVATIRVALDPAPTTPGALLVLTELPGVTISVDGNVTGTTPLDEAIPIPSGAHVIELSRDGYEHVRAEITVGAGEVVRLERDVTPMANLPAEIAGGIELQIAADAAQGAVLVLDGAPLGSGPVPSGPHVLEVRHPDFETWTGQIDVTAGAPTPVQVTLVPTEAYQTRLERRSSRWWLAGWLTTGLAVAVLGTTLGLYLWNRSRAAGAEQDMDDLEPQLRDCPPLGVSDRCDGLWAQWQSANNLSDDLEAWDSAEWAMLGVGAAALTVGIALLASRPRPGSATQVSLGPGPGELSLALNVSWGGGGRP